MVGVVPIDVGVAWRSNPVGQWDVDALSVLDTTRSAAMEHLGGAARR